MSNEYGGSVEFNAPAIFSKELAKMTRRSLHATMAGATKAAAKPSYVMAKNRVPVRTGMLKRALYIKSVQYKRNSYASAMLGLNKNIQHVPKQEGGSVGIKRIAKKIGKLKIRGNIKPYKYAHFVDRSTKPHMIPSQKNRRGQLLRDPSKAKGNLRGIFGRVVRHPGTKGTGFMTRSFWVTRRTAQVKMVGHVGSRLFRDYQSIFAKAKQGTV